MLKRSWVFSLGCALPGALFVACGTPTATVGTTTNQTPTATAVGLHPLTDWTPASAINAFAKDVQFAPSAPATGYACGMSAPNTTVQIGVTHDGGVTWQTSAIQALSGVNCALIVSPTVPTDLVMNLTICSPPNSDCNYGFPIYRSQDGGQHWSLVTLPADNGGIEGQATWVGDDLFILADAKLAPTQQLAASKAGAPTQWLNLSSLYAQVGGGATSSATIFSLGTTLSLVVSTATCATQCPIAQSVDGGATWVVIPPTVNTPSELQANHDGKTLLGIRQDGHGYLRSIDGGKTWVSLPTLPQGNDTYSVLGFGPTAPDGTLYTIQEVDQPEAAGPGARQILKLAPGANDWLNLDFHETVYTPLSVSCDAQGHPLALWGGKPWTRAVNSLPGVAYRLP